MTNLEENISDKKGRNQQEIDILSKMANFQNKKLKKVNEEQKQPVKSAKAKKND